MHNIAADDALLRCLRGKRPPAAEPSTMAVRRLDRGSELGRQVAATKLSKVRDVAVA